MNNLKISLFNNVYRPYEPSCVKCSNYKPAVTFC